MANETYTLIQKTTLNASAASITFSSIPQTFTDLVIKVSARTDEAAANWSQSNITFNSSSTSYTNRYLLGTGSAASSGSAGTAYVYGGRGTGAGATASTFGNSEVYIPNYTSANYKSVSTDEVTENNATAGLAFMNAGLWSNTAAITSLTITAQGCNFVQYTEATLYGVAKQGVTPVAGPKASGGDIITNDGTYWIHQFLNSGTFTPSQTLSCDYLVVAGGGGSGSDSGGGGGAGGLRSTVTATGGGGSLESAMSLSFGTNYTVQIGAGGNGASFYNTVGTVGGNSIFNTITSTGGGFGSSNDLGYLGVAGNGAPGGSGGGAGGGGTGSGNHTPGSATPSGQGFAGGVNYSTGGGQRAGGGGGGAGAVGTNGQVSNVGGNGGAGVATLITGSSVTLGGGGGANGANGAVPSGGLGGAGGGGAANNAGTVNTGGGGGASFTAGTNGGSGIVIIRYAI